VDISADDFSVTLAGTSLVRTFRGAHEEIKKVGKPAGHQTELAGNGGDFRVCQRLRNEHHTDGDAGQNVVEEPSWIIAKDPVNHWHLFDKIMASCTRECSSSSRRPATPPLEVGILGQKRTGLCEKPHDVLRLRSLEKNVMERL